MGSLLTRRGVAVSVAVANRSDVIADSGGDGEAVALLRHVGHRYVAGIRLVTLVPTVVIAALATGDAAGSRWVTLMALVVLMSWSLAYSWALIRRPDPWVTVIDAAVLSGVALSSSWIVSPNWLISGKSWLLPFLAFACVAYQYYASPLLGSLAALAVLTSMIIGTSIAVPARGSFDSVHTAIWSIVLVVLARVFWILVHRGGRRADAALAAAARARQEQLLAQEIRADELEHNRRLHDTAATTLLMVGLGQARRSASVLTAQARRDVEALSGQLELNTDLVAEIAAVIDLAPLAVDYRYPNRLHLPSAVVHAMKGATQEALGNIVRHTAVNTCVVAVAGDEAGVCIEIIDTGDGFDALSVSSRGRGLSESISSRMTGVGGSAVVASCLGSGTSVQLMWPDADQ